MRRREFIASVAALGAWSASVRAQQQPQRIRKLGIIMAVGKTPEYTAALAALEQALDSLGGKTATTCGLTSAGRREARTRPLCRARDHRIKPGPCPRAIGGGYRGAAIRDENDPDRISARCRPGGLRLRVEPGAT